MNSYKKLLFLCLFSVFSLNFSDPLLAMHQELQWQPDHEICTLISNSPDLAYSFWTSQTNLCDRQAHYPTLMSTMKNDGKFIKIANKELGPWLFLFDAQTNENWKELIKNHPMHPGKYSYFKLHLQVKPEYLYACAETFARLLLMENSPLQEFVLGFKVSLNPSAPHHFNEHRVPTMVIYLDPIIFPQGLFVGPECAKNPNPETLGITRNLVKEHLDKAINTIYKIFGAQTIEQIGLNYTPRFNKRINNLMYIAGYHSHSTKKYLLKDNDPIRSYYTDDLVFVIGAEYDPNQLIL